MRWEPVLFVKVVFLKLNTLILGVLSGVLLFSCADNKEALNILIWGEYLAEELVRDFEEAYQVRVHYTTYDSAEQMFLKYRVHPGVYDLLVPPEYMAHRMLEQDLLEPLSKSKMPNLALIDKDYVRLDFDPDMHYVVPYFVSALGVLYNTEHVLSPHGWQSLFSEEYAGKILMIDGFREAFASALLFLGESINTSDRQAITLAKELLKEQKSGVLAYGVDSLKYTMAKGEAWISLAWTGDALPAMRENPALDFYLPEEGFVYSMDCWVIPKDAPRKDLAMEFINFVYETENNRKNAEIVGYQTPHFLAREELLQKSIIAKKLYPSAQEVQNAQIFEHFAADLTNFYLKQWTEIIDS